MSNLVNFINTIAALSVSDGTSTPTALKHSTLKDAIESADCPARIVLPFDEGNGAEFGFLSASTGSVAWTIRDMYLAGPVGENTGWRSFALKLDTYAANYITAFKAARSTFCGYNASDVSINLQRDVFSYGAAGKQYYGVMVTYAIEETI